MNARPSDWAQAWSQLCIYQRGGMYCYAPHKLRRYWAYAFDHFERLEIERRATEHD